MGTWMRWKVSWTKHAGQSARAGQRYTALHSSRQRYTPSQACNASPRPAAALLEPLVVLQSGGDLFERKRCRIEARRPTVSRKRGDNAGLTLRRPSFRASGFERAALEATCQHFCVLEPNGEHRAAGVAEGKVP